MSGSIPKSEEIKMQALIKKHGDVTVVELTGKLDFETAEPFRQTCLDNLSNNKVVFNLTELSFVGSSGIGAFVTTLKQFAKVSPVSPKFCYVKSEFRKIFQSDEQPFEIFDDLQTAISAFKASQIP